MLHKAALCMIWDLLPCLLPCGSDKYLAAGLVHEREPDVITGHNV
jgi:hypothetical protein